QSRKCASWIGTTDSTVHSARSRPIPVAGDPGVPALRRNAPLWREAARPISPACPVPPQPPHTPAHGPGKAPQGILPAPVRTDAPSPDGPSLPDPQTAPVADGERSGNHNV